MVRGDGEKALSLLLSGAAKSRIPGLLYRIDGRAASNGVASQSIQDEVMPDFDGLPLELYTVFTGGNKQLLLPYRTSDGCLNSCSFCSHRIFHRPQVKSVDKVGNELGQLRDKYRSDIVYFCDSTFNMDPAHMRSLCDRLKGIELRWIGGYVRPAGIDRGSIRKMVQSGCAALFFGVDSGSDTILKRMNKGFTIGQAERVLANTHRERILASTFLVVDYPQETDDEFKETLAFVRRNAPTLFDVIPQPFHLEFNSQLLKHPRSAGLENVRWNHRSLVEDIEGNNFMYDESRGLHWNGIRERQKRKLDQLDRVVYRHIRRKQDALARFVPYGVYRRRNVPGSLVARAVEQYKKLRRYDDPWLFHLRHAEHAG